MPEQDTVRTVTSKEILDALDSKGLSPYFRYRLSAFKRNGHRVATVLFHAPEIDKAVKRIKILTAKVTL